MNSELVEERLKELISAFKKDLDSKHEQLNCFCKHGVQLEGWLKGELIYFLEKQKKLRLLWFSLFCGLCIGYWFFTALQGRKNSVATVALPKPVELLQLIACA